MKDLIEIFGIKNIARWLAEIPNFYFRPAQFFLKIFSKSDPVIFKQTTVYVLMLSVLMWVFSDMSEKETAKISIANVSVSFIVIIFILPGYLLIKRMTSQNVNYLHVISFVVISRTLFALIISPLISIYIKTERYEVLFMINILSTLFIVFLLFYCNKIFFTKIKHLFIGVFVNFLIINLMIFGVLYFKFDNVGLGWMVRDLGKEIDPISFEYMQAAEKLDSTNRLPYGKLEYNFKYPKEAKGTITYYNFLDGKNKLSITDPNFFKNVDTTRAYMKKVNSAFDYLMKAIKTTKFRKNKKIFSTWALYLADVMEDFSGKNNSITKVVQKHPLFATINGKVKRVGEVIEYSENERLTSGYFNLLEARVEYLNGYDKATTPYLFISVIFFPVGFAIDKFKLIDMDSLNNEIYLNSD